MNSNDRLRRLLFMLGAVTVLIGSLVGTQLATKPVSVQAVTPINVFAFHCALLPNVPLESSNLGSFNLTQTGGTIINPSDCSQVMADALNAGFHLKSALALPNGGPGGTGATEYVFVRGSNQ